MTLPLLKAWGVVQGSWDSTWSCDFPMRLQSRKLHFPLPFLFHHQISLEWNSEHLLLEQQLLKYKEFSTGGYFYVQMCLRSQITDHCSFTCECLLFASCRRKEMHIADVSKMWGLGERTAVGGKGFSTNSKTCQIKNMNL